MIVLLVSAIIFTRFISKGLVLPSKKKSLSRNDPCFCGSGKKFKKCCINKDIKPCDEQSEHYFNRQYFGYNQPASQDENPFELNEDGLVCVVSNVCVKNIRDLNEITGLNLCLGDWIVSTAIINDNSHKHEIYGPVPTLEEAMDIGRKEAGVIRYKLPPEIDML